MQDGVSDELADARVRDWGSVAEAVVAAAGFCCGEEGGGGGGGGVSEGRHGAKGLVMVGGGRELGGWMGCEKRMGIRGRMCGMGLLLKRDQPRCDKGLAMFQVMFERQLENILLHWLYETSLFQLTPPDCTFYIPC